jgi:hypothetical protein
VVRPKGYRECPEKQKKPRRSTAGPALENSFQLPNSMGYSPAVGGKVAIVTAGNAEYFHHLDGLIASLEDAGLSGDFCLCALDVGLTPQQAENLVARHVTVVVPSWAVEFPYQEEAPEWFRAMTNRPCLPHHFPGFDIYLWIDADTWIQHPAGIYAAVEAAGKGPIAIVAERFGKGIVYPEWTPFGLMIKRVDERSSRAAVASCYRHCFGPETEERAREAIFNTGFFALRGDSPIWDRWLKRIRQGVARSFHKLLEQQALNLEILEGTIPATVLPKLFNWMLTSEQPIFDLRARQVVDPAEHKSIAMVHLTDVKHLRYVEIPSLEGRTVRLWLQYRDFRGKSPVVEDVWPFVT